MRAVLKGQRVVKAKGVVLEDDTILPFDIKVLAYIPRKVDRNRYVKVYQDHILEKVLNNQLKKSDLAVFMWFLSQNDWGNDWIYIDYEDLANELGMHKVTVKKAIRQLVDSGLIMQYKPRKNLFRLNPAYVYKGGVVGKEQDIDF